MDSVTVIVCTYNRAEMLATALNSLNKITMPDSVDWEVLIVDNNSNDSTRDVAMGFCTSYPNRFRYLFESHPGLSYARNAGIQAARGQILAFTDDDITMEPTWLQNLTASLHDGRWAGAGGRILPEQSFSPPSWLSLEDKYALAPLALFDRGSDARELLESPFGANMAFRKSVFDEHGGFRTDLGRTPNSMMSNEDSEFGIRLRAAHERLRYEPTAVIYHPVSEDRLKKEYFLQWSFYRGRSDIRQVGVRPNTRFFLWGVPLYLIRNIVSWGLRWLFTFPSASRFSAKLSVWGKWGEIVECWRQSSGLPDGSKVAGSVSGKVIV